MNCSPEQIKDILALVAPYGVGGFILVLAIIFKDAVTEVIKTVLSWFKRK
jgi:hypothetical protein